MTETVSRVLIRIPLLIGVILLSLAIVLTLAGDDLGLFSYLLMILGGLSLGFAFVNTTLHMRSTVNGAALHIAVAVVLAATMIVVIEYGGEFMADLAPPLRATALVLQIAVIPAAGWIWLGLLSRISDLFRRRDAKKRPAPAPPEWERDASGDGSVFRFRGIEMRLRTLSWWIAGVTVVVGLGGTALVIALDEVVVHLGARLAILLVGVVLALPAYLVIMNVLRRRTLECTVAFGNDEIRLRIGDHHHRIAYRDLERLTWRSHSEYARIEVVTPGADLSVFSGLAKPERGRTADLPSLPRRVYRRLELEGFVVEHTRRGVVHFKHGKTAL